MKVLISPAKSLNFKDTVPTSLKTNPVFIEESKEIDGVLKDISPKGLSELMDISDALADLNWQRNQNRMLRNSELEQRQAIFMFDGDVYTGLDAYHLPSSAFDQLQSDVRILSGLYGILKPFDVISAYRLEMGTKLTVGSAKDLYGFWKDKVTAYLDHEMQSNEPIVNLASKEYSSVVHFKKLNRRVITPEFKDYKDGKLKMISFFAKKARGSMVRYILDKGISNVENLKNFDYEGYAFDASLSKGDTWVFTR